MRFYSNGPNIPDILLNRRDQGRVVFLCGAGVSLDAGMPSFVGLTKHIFKYFDPPGDSQLSISFKPWDEKVDGPKVPLDQIFHMLYQEYGKNDVNALVAERLQQKGATVSKSRNHKTIASISSDLEGNPQIVTTNFDRLFENVIEGSKPKIYEPPALPDISLGVSVTGITYLHGRLQEPDDIWHPYVLSSADFGRAYLSEGWATNFIQSLLDRYTVVLVGYQAEDSPVKYLLQGLNHDGLSDRSNLYVFDKGNFEEIETKWRDRGVTAIAYNDHSDLWESLGAWSERAEDPRKWCSNLIELSLSGPRKVSAHERGQVAHLVRTTPGARLFAYSEPSPPAEWLCVFDASCRSADISRGYDKDAEIFDPIEVYGLDDDPPRPKVSGRGVKWINDHILEWNRGDKNPTTNHKIGGREPSGFEDMPPRLFHLSNWILKKLDSPVAAWWALRQNRIHPRIVQEIHVALRRNSSLHQKARRTWNFILEYQSSIREFHWDDGWFDLKDRIKIEGWNQSVLREFEGITKPILTHTLPLGVEASRPPFEGWENINLGELTEWKIKIPKRHVEEVEILDNYLVSVFRIAETNLYRAANLLDDLNTIYFNRLTCYPERDIDGEVRNQDVNFEWFLKLFKRMVSNHPSIARAHSIIWPTDKKYFFRMLKLYALNHVELFTGDESVQIVLSLDQSCFWDINVRRELLYLIHDRWDEFSSYNKISIANRLLDGPNKRDGWSDDYYQKIKNELACTYTSWLILNGVDISEEQTTRLCNMVSRLDEWSDSRAKSFVIEHFGGSGWVKTDEKPDTIIDLPVNMVVEQVKTDHQREHGSFTDKRPFAGLVKVKPRKALAVLSLSARKDKYPQELWSTLIKDWPEETKSRLFCLFLNRIAQLPANVIQDIRHTVGGWVRYRFRFAYEFDQRLSWKVLDHLLISTVSGEVKTAESRIEDEPVSGDIDQKSRRTYDHAINGPIGEITEGLLNTLNTLSLEKSQGIPDTFKKRFQSLLETTGEGRDHAITILAHSVSWLYFIDPEWAMKKIMPWFSFDNLDAEPAWNGYLWGIDSTSTEIRVVLKPYLLELFPRIYKWSWDEYPAEIATKHIITLAIFRGDEPDGLNNKEARQCLRNMNNNNRRDAVFQLGQIGKNEEDGWSAHVIPFIKWIWPKEHGFRTSSLVSSWVSILDDTGESFPAVFRAVRLFLVPVEGNRLQLYRFSRETGEEQPLTVKYPDTVLALLEAVVPNNADDLPYELEQILKLVVENNANLVGDRRYLRLINLIENR
ncbi:MAG: SIR2 family protein [Candidatus Thiodiazotropha taylori]|nr:SIR2 family protein [Candidatus Thiodiazotropha taylori]